MISSCLPVQPYPRLLPYFALHSSHLKLLFDHLFSINTWHILAGLSAFMNVTCSTWTHSNKYILFPSTFHFTCKKSTNPSVLSLDVMYSKSLWDEQTIPFLEPSWCNVKSLILALKPCTKAVCLGFSSKLGTCSFLAPHPKRTLYKCLLSWTICIV